MESSSQQMTRNTIGERKEEGEETVHEGLPMESSPYLKYDDLEEYKQNAYGTQGHQEVKPMKNGGGATDGPTLSGNARFPDATTAHDIGVAAAAANFVKPSN